MFPHNTPSEWRNIGRCILAAWALLLCTGLTASVAAADTPPEKEAKGAATTSCPIGGSIVPSPNLASGSNTLWAVDAASEHDIWAVGQYIDGRRISQVLIERWNGQQWSTVSTPVFNGESLLYDVAVISSNDVWAVGLQPGSGANSAPLTMHWDGSRWSVIPSPNVGLQSRLTAVEAISSNDVWAVGSAPFPAPGRSLTMHWDGNRWTVVPSPNASRGSTTLSGVSAVSSSDVWAVGYFAYCEDDICFSKPFAMRWDGQRWSITPTPDNTRQFSGLEDVEAISSFDVWAVGNDATIMHWNGAYWSASQAPAPTWRLSDVSATGPDNVWAVGEVYNTRTDPFVLRWNGSQWSVVPSVNGGSWDTLHGVVALAPDNVWAVGRNTDPTIDTPLSLVQHWDGNQMRVVPSANVRMGPNYLRDVVVISANDIWAVGSYTTYQHRTLTLHWDGQQWQTIPSPNPGAEQSTAYSNVLHGVAATSPNDVWAVGYSGSGSGLGGLAMHWDGVRWTVTPANGVLNAVTAISPNDAWAVGYWRYEPNGTSGIAINHWTGSRWDYWSMPDISGPDVALNSVTSLSANDVWAVGTLNGRTLTMHYNGTSWRVVPSPNVGSERNTLRGVKALSPNDVWAVGYYGAPGTGQALILRWDGTQWNVIPVAAAGTDSFLFDVEPVTPDDVWAVGNYVTERGTPQKALVEHWDGRTWSVVPNPNVGTAASFLFGIDAVSPEQLWAVGDYDQQTSHWTLTERLAPQLFADVPEGSTFYPYVRCLVERNILSGYADCTFRPNNDITRGQLSKIVSNSANFNEDPGPQIFEDVPPTSTFYDWIQRLARRGHISGYPCGSPGEPCNPGNRSYFRPNANATRAQISKIVSNARGYNDPAGTQIFEDVPPSHGFYEWIQRLARQGAMGGYECGGPNEPCGAERRPYFRPNNNATRGQTSKIVANSFFPECNP